MAWRRPRDKPLSEPMLVQFTDAYVRHKGEISQPSLSLDEFMVAYVLMPVGFIFSVRASSLSSHQIMNFLLGSPSLYRVTGSRPWWYTQYDIMIIRNIHNRIELSPVRFYFVSADNVCQSWRYACAYIRQRTESSLRLSELTHCDLAMPLMT